MKPILLSEVRMLTNDEIKDLIAQQLANAELLDAVLEAAYGKMERFSVEEADAIKKFGLSLGVFALDVGVPQYSEMRTKASETLEKFCKGLPLPEDKAYDGGAIPGTMRKFMQRRDGWENVSHYSVAKMAAWAARHGCLMFDARPLANDAVPPACFRITKKEQWYYPRAWEKKKLQDLWDVRKDLKGPVLAGVKKIIGVEKYAVERVNMNTFMAVCTEVGNAWSGGFYPGLLGLFVPAEEKITAAEPVSTAGPDDDTKKFFTKLLDEKFELFANRPVLPQVFEEILEERARQDEKWGGPEHDKGHSMHDWVAFLVKHTGKAIRWPWDMVVFRKQMIRVAALAVAAVEAVDRRNA